MEPVDPRLRLAVDASRAWYDDVFALHGVPVVVDGGLWRSLGKPPPWHSVAKTLEPGGRSGAVVEAMGASGSVADSFADLDLPGFTLLFEATWLHHEGGGGGGRREGGGGRRTGAAMPAAWSEVTTPHLLARWSERHDYVGVLPEAVLDRPAFTVLGRFDGEELVGGAVLHDNSGAVGLSNAWSEPGHTLDWDELLAAARAIHPGRVLTDYARGDDLDGMLAAGFQAVGTQRVWLR